MAENLFHVWLAKKIKTLNLDEEIYLEYIKGVFEENGDEEEETKETLVEILSGVLVCICILFYIYI